MSKNNNTVTEEIFKFINPKENTKLSLMSGYDLQDLMILFDEYYMKLRNKLGFDPDITFGFELEYEHAKNEKIRELLSEKFLNHDWCIKSDATLSNGAEINSPVLRDNVKTWEDLDSVCKIVRPLATIGVNSGGHIHVGAHILGKNSESWLNFIKLWSVYENIIFRFSYGEFLTGRPKILNYAKPMSKYFYEEYENFEDDSVESIISRLSDSKYKSVHFGHVDKTDCNRLKKKNTIEFRCPNGSLNPVIWQNNVNLFVRLLNYSKSRKYDDDLIKKRNKINLDIYSNLNLYDEIYLEQALELCDMIFTNNLDKINFLKQYLKSFKNNIEKKLDYKEYKLTK